MNAASPSRWERFGWAPLVFGLAVVSLQLSRSGAVDNTRRTNQVEVALSTQMTSADVRDGRASA